MAFKKILVNSVDIYDKIIEVLCENGWQNIASVGNRTPGINDPLRTSEPGAATLTTTAITSATAAALSTFKYDWDVLRHISSGAVVQMMPYCPSNADLTNTAPNITPANDIRRSTVKTFGMRMLKGFTPGAHIEVDETDGFNLLGVPQPAKPWVQVHLFATDNATPATVACPLTVTNVEMLYSTDMESAIFVFRWPPTLTNRKCTFFYIGVPQSVRGERSGAHDAILAQTFMPGTTGNKIIGVDYPIGVGDVANNAYLSMDSQIQLPLRNPSYLQEYWLTPIYYGHATILGMRGKLDGMYALAANIGLIDKDQIIIGEKTYEVCELAVNSTYCSFGASWMAVELDID